MNAEGVTRSQVGPRFRENPFEKKGPFYKNIYFLLFVFGAAFLTLIRPFMRHEPAPPQVISVLPKFALVNQYGEVFGSEHLNGKVYLASFIFTRCQTICPAIAQKVQTLQKKFAEANLPVQLVSFSVDPEFDSPSVLLDYAKKWSLSALGNKGLSDQTNSSAKELAGAPTWTFLTGDTAQMREVLTGFAFSLEAPRLTEPGGMMDIAHSAKLVLVDWQGGIRGYYDSNAEGLDEAFHRAKHVVAQQQKLSNGGP